MVFQQIIFSKKDSIFSVFPSVIDKVCLFLQLNEVLKGYKVTNSLQHSVTGQMEEFHARFKQRKWSALRDELSWVSAAGPKVSLD